MICAVTGTRADYFLLRPLLARLEDVRLIVTGSHLSTVHGSTWREIEGLMVRMFIPLTDSPEGMAESMAAALTKSADILSEMRPDLLLVLGDRYETLACATAAYILGIPIAHIQGGEVTLGSLDDAFRHSITHMASLHLVSCPEAAAHVYRLGAREVFVTGSLGVDNAVAHGPRDSKGYALVCVHPAKDDVLDSVLEALEGWDIVCTGPNADPGNSRIRERLQGHRYIESAGEGFLTLMAEAEVCVGNSSAFVIEAPSLKVGSVDVGDRQRGRVRAHSVIHASDPNAIRAAIHVARQYRGMTVENPYGDGHAAEKMEAALRRMS